MIARVHLAWVFGLARLGNEEDWLRLRIGLERRWGGGVSRLGLICSWGSCHRTLKGYR